MEIPDEVKNVISKLKKAKFEAYVVGGCVRDFLRGVEGEEGKPSSSPFAGAREPEDWDVTTNAKPEEIQKVFPDSFYENNFLTVTVRVESKNPKLKEIEITTYRSEAKYSDKRHPDIIQFAKTLEDDLARRDFTVNAIAIGLLKSDFNITDPFGGQKDLDAKIIRAVGNPEERFGEDALRLMRAVRLATSLGRDWRIEEKTAAAIKKLASSIKVISQERIRDELIKIIMSDRAAEGIELLRELGLLKHIIPELEEGYGVAQNKHHIYECYWHLVLSLKYAAEKKFNKFVRLASLLHDVGKPRAKRGEGQDATFYNHEIVGAKMASQILNRLKFSKKDNEKITKLVRYHLFYYNPGEVGESSIRRLVRNVGPEYVEELLQVRMADRIGSGVPKAEPYKLRHLKYVIDKVSQDPISAKMLKANGEDVMKILDIKPGPKVGQILDVLLGYVIEDPKKNDKEVLEKEIKRLGSLPEKELSSLAQKAEKEREEVETKRDEMTKAKYWVT
ncbi:MAG: HD domain-containing protein [Candidatus Wildermuthbacteria bacterium]|nr:HD domain-containing protein [Candidatus Wildermuthbacteria bacterium]